MMIVSCSRRRQLNGKGMTQLVLLLSTLVVVLLGVVSGFHEMSPLPTTTFPRDNISRDSRITTSKSLSFVSSSCRHQDVLTFSSSIRSMARIRPTTRCSDKGLCATNNGLGGDGSSDDGYDNSDELSRTSSKQQQQQIGRAHV